VSTHTELVERQRRRVERWQRRAEKAAAELVHCQAKVDRHLSKLVQLDPSTADATQSLRSTPEPAAQPRLQLEVIFTRKNASHGAISAVAKRLGVAPSHVAQVSRGLRTSARVTAELHQEMANRGFEAADRVGAA